MDLNLLPRDDDQRSPDASVGTLARHAQTLASNVRVLNEALSEIKVTVADADRLDALATTLEQTEDEWRTAQKAAAPGTVAECRVPLLAGRNRLYKWIGVLVTDDDTRRALVEIGGVDNDADLALDAKRLVELARTHVKQLKGTRITPVVVDRVETDLKAFNAARKGVRSGPDAKPDAKATTTQQALAEASRVALERRNRVYWALAKLDRDVCGRGRVLFEEDGDVKRAALFAAYTADAGGGGATPTGAVDAEPTEPTEPTPPAPPAPASPVASEAPAKKPKRAK